MSEFLDRLAMEVVEWGNGSTKDPMRWVAICDEVVENGMLKKSPVGWLAFNDDGDRAAVHQWLQRRKELINEPDVADAPGWAGWVAQDSNGFWYWHENEPSLDRLGWQSNGRLDHAGEGEVPAGRDWRKTLKEVNQMDDLKEVKLAWANGEIVQYFYQGDDTWEDWGNSQNLSTDWYNEWRVKPKSRTHSQWERKFYCPNSGVVMTAYNTLSDQFPSNVRWVSEPEFHTYEVEE